jgi:hypothetical protein
LGQPSNRTLIQISLWIGNKVTEERGTVISRTHKTRSSNSSTDEVREDWARGIFEED